MVIMTSMDKGYLRRRPPGTEALVRTARGPDKVRLADLAHPEGPESVGLREPPFAPRVPLRTASSGCAGHLCGKGPPASPAQERAPQHLRTARDAPGDAICSAEGLRERYEAPQASAWSAQSPGCCCGETRLPARRMRGAHLDLREAAAAGAAGAAAAVLRLPDMHLGGSRVPPDLPLPLPDPRAATALNRPRHLRASRSAPRDLRETPWARRVWVHMARESERRLCRRRRPPGDVQTRIRQHARGMPPGWIHGLARRGKSPWRARGASSARPRAPRSGPRPAWTGGFGDLARGRLRLAAALRPVRSRTSRCPHPCWLRVRLCLSRGQRRLCPPSPCRRALACSLRAPRASTSPARSPCIPPGRPPFPSSPPGALWWS